MAKPTWNQAGGQVQAAKLMSYGDALKPAINWAQRAVETENRKAEIEKKNKFMAERDAIKNQWSQEAADKQRKLTSSENEANRVISRARNEDMAKYHEGSLRNQETQIEQSGKYNAGMLKLRQDDLRFKTNQATAKEKREKERRAASAQMMKTIFGNSTVPTRKAVVGTKLVDNIGAQTDKAISFSDQFKEIGDSINADYKKMPKSIQKLVSDGATRDQIRSKVSELVKDLSEGAGSVSVNLNRAQKRAAKKAGMTPLEYATDRGLTDKIKWSGEKGSKAIAKRKELEKIRGSLSAYDRYTKGIETAQAVQSKMNRDVSSVPKLKENIIGDVVDDTANYQRLVDERNRIYQSAPLLDDTGIAAANMGLKGIGAKIKDYDTKRAALALEREKGKTKEKEIAAGLYKIDQASAQKEFDRLRESGDASVKGYNFINWYKKKYGTSKK